MRNFDLKAAVRSQLLPDAHNVCWSWTSTIGTLQDVHMLWALSDANTEAITSTDTRFRCQQRDCALNEFACNEYLLYWYSVTEY